MEESSRGGEEKRGRGEGEKEEELQEKKVPILNNNLAILKHGNMFSDVGTKL